MWPFRWILACISVAQVLLTALSGAEPAGAESRRAGFLLRHHTTPLRWEIIDGHFSISNLGSLSTATIAANAPTEPPVWKEMLAINPSGEESLNYRYTKDDHTFHVEWKERTLTILEQQGKNVFHFTQSPTGEMTLISLTDNKSTQELTVHSLWHCAILFPTVFEQELLPQLERLNGGWGLREQARVVRESLDKEVLGNWPAARREWRTAVDELASPEYRVRQTALVKLKAGGASALAYLRNLPQDELNVEQARSVAYLIQEAIRRRDDPTHAAAGLVYDQQLWWEMLAHPNETTRALAAQHLSRLLERELRFNPLGDAPSRLTQLQLIRESLQGTVKR